LTYNNASKKNIEEKEKEKTYFIENNSKELVNDESKI
jgi:hypothetical protein